MLLLADFPVISDAGQYRLMAIDIVRGKTFIPYWPPGLPLYLAEVYKLFNNVGEPLSRAAMLPFYVVNTILLYLLVQDIVSRRTANIAALVFTLYPNYIYHSVIPLTQLPVATCFLIIVYCIHLITSRRLVWWLVLVLSVMVGAALGYGVLIRSSSLVIVGFIPLYLIYRRQPFYIILTPVIVAAGIIGTYQAALYDRAGEFILINTSNSYNAYVGNSETTPLYRTWLFASDKDRRSPEFAAVFDRVNALPPADQDKAYRELLIDDVLARPDLFVIRTLNRIRAFFGFDTFTGTRLVAEDIATTPVALLIVGIDSLFYITISLLAISYFFLRDLLTTRSAVPVLLILGISLLYAAPYFVAFSHATYHFPVLMLMAVFAAVTFEGLSSQEIRPQIIKRLRSRRVIAAFVLFALIQLEWGVFMVIEFLET